MFFLPAFFYATKGTSIRLIDAVKAMLPCFVVTIVAVAAVWALRIDIATGWHPLVRLLSTGAVIAVIMACGWLLLYRPSGWRTLLTAGT